MITKKLSGGMKFLIATIVVAMVMAAAFGVSSIFAEPSIEDLVEEHIHDIGTFTPNKLFDQEDYKDEIEIVAWLNTTQLMFSYDWWFDSNEDGMIEVEDIYQQEGFESEMLMTNVLYPIFELGEDYDYYVAAFPDYAYYNDSVVINLQIGENNDLANLKDISTYWFDRENNLLYIHKSMIQKDLEGEEYASIRSETIMLVKDVQEATKTVNVYTLFDANIGDMRGMDKNTPNGEYSFNIIDWELSGATYQLVQPEHLAYVSAENLTVYMNATETDAWVYDEITGEITIATSPYVTTDIVVKFNELNDNVTMAENALQRLQATTDSDVGYAAAAVTLDQALTSNNIFLKSIAYEDVGPQVGAFQELGYYLLAQVYGDGVGENETVSVGGAAVWVNDTVPYDVLKDTLKEAAKTNKGFFHSTTLSGAVGHFRTDYAKEVSDYYGQVVGNMYLAHKTGNTAYINSAVAVAQNHLLNDVYREEDPNSWNEDPYAFANHALTTRWGVAGNGRYIVGTSNPNFLGGKVSSGVVAFDATCGKIDAVNLEGRDLKAEMEQEWGPSHPDKWQAEGYDYRANATLLAVKPNTAGDGGYLYIGVWSKTMVDGDDWENRHQANKNVESQRILAFSRVPYTYDGGGKIRLTKTNVAGDPVAGAIYAVYSNSACTNEVTRITSDTRPIESIELPAGTYYVKEVYAPEGYELDGTRYTVPVVGGSVPYELRVVDSYQSCDFTFTAYDATTKGSTEMPVPGLTFKLYNPEHTLIGTYTTNTSGKLVDADGDTTFNVRANGVYTLEQDGTVTNYCMIDDVNRCTIHSDSQNDYCKSIAIDATPTTGGKKTVDLKHYEHRQIVAVKSQVQDGSWPEANRGNTPAVLGGSEGGYVATVGATYQLRAMTDLLLGYVNGSAVTIPAQTVLDVWNGVGSQSYSTVVTSYKASDDRAYISAVRVQKKHTDGRTYNFPLPNGTYQWELIKPSSGYWKDPNTVNTAIDASWKTGNITKSKISFADYPVKMMRQTAEISLFVKSYTTEYEVGARIDNLEPQIVTLDDKVYTSLINRSEALRRTDVSNWMRFVDDNYKKTVTSNNATVSDGSQEQATLFKKDGTGLHTIVAEDSVQHAIYEIAPLVDIVDVTTGTEIKRGTCVGLYITNSDGAVIITKLGSEAFDNPNERTQNSIGTRVGKIVPLGENNTMAVGDLPNGVYGLSCRDASDGYDNKVGLSEDIVTELSWDGDDTNKSWEHGKISANSAVFVYEYLEEDVGIPVAPNPDPDPRPGPGETPPPSNPNNPDDPYDPQHPDDPNGNPDDSNDIPKVDPDWVEKHRDDYAYRIVDLDNFDPISADKTLEVRDTTPQTFAFYINEDEEKEEGCEYSYLISFYYEIPKSEYDASSASERKSEEFMVRSSVYMRRFGTEYINTDNKLTDLIVLNKTSDGYISYSEAKPEAAVSGALVDAEWLNGKLANSQLMKDSGNDYSIWIRVDATKTYTTKFSELLITKGVATEWGELKIRNRILTPLD